ncbi:MAG TPA: fibronectin type III domain-containing protein, partial [Candidatus Nitrosotalea sp.]|nr:fibronectin type III domain-containing protein [Candidatus Nitrosotalea sp.]
MSKSRLSIVLFILAIILIPSYLSANYNLIPSANATGTILYGADTSNLYSIDPTTGLTTLIGPIGTTITGMDFDNTGVLTGIDGNIITINTSTGTGTILFPNATPLPCDGGFAFDSDIATTATDGDKFLCNIFVGQTIFMTSPNPISFDTVNQLNLDPSDTSAFGGTTIGSDDDVYLADQDLLYTFNQPLQSDLTFSSEKPLNFGSFSPDTNCGPISLSFNSSGTLFAVVSCDTNHYLATINTSTGMVSKISTLPGFIAIAFGNPSSVTAPSAPTGLTTTSGNGQVSLSWAAPLSNGGSSITSYNIYRGTSSGGEGSTPYATVSGSTISYTDNGATNGNTYYYIVKAVNSAGTSPASNEASATPTAPATAPSAPTGLTTTSGNGQVSLSWAAPLSNGGSSITSYNI